MHLRQGLQATLPQRQGGRRSSRLFQRMAQALHGLACLAQITHDKGLLTDRHHGGHAQAAGRQGLQALHLGGNGLHAAGIGHGLQRRHLQPVGDPRQGAIAPCRVGGPGAFQPQAVPLPLVALHQRRLVGGVTG